MNNRNSAPVKNLKLKNEKEKSISQPNIIKHEPKKRISNELLDWLDFIEQTKPPPSNSPISPSSSFTSPSHTPSGGSSPILGEQKSKKKLSFLILILIQKFPLFLFIPA